MMRFLSMRAAIVGVLLALVGTNPCASTEAPVAPAPGKLAPGQPIPPLELERFVDGAVRDAMDAEHIAGVSVSVIQGDRTVLLKGYGIAGAGQKMDPSRTLVRIGSVSKTFVWIALLKAAEQGLVNLDAPVNDYLPAELKIPDEGFKQPIRLVDLMSHAGGFEDSALGHLFVYRDEAILPLATYLARHRPHRVREPGQFATYSNYGAALAGYIVARVDGQDFESLIERELFAPLEMTSTTFREPYAPRQGLPTPMNAELAQRLSDGFAWQGSRFRPMDFEHISQIAPAGSVSTTAADMARYMIALNNEGRLGGAQIYGPATARLLRTPILDTAEGVNGWAHGFMARNLPGGIKTYGHGGATRIFFTNMVVIPALNLGVFANSNSTTGRALVERLPKLIVEHFYLPAPAAPLPGDRALVKAADLYAGEYIPTRRAYFGLEKFVDLLGFDDKVWVTGDGYLIAKTGSVTRAWVPDGAPGRFRAADGGPDRLRFKTDAKGRAISFPIERGNYTLERAGLDLDSDLFVKSAVLALATALAIWICAFVRIGPRIRPTRWQARGRMISLGVAALWLAAFAAFNFFEADADPEMSVWPSPGAWIASLTALCAAAGSLALLATTPLIWLGANEMQGGWPWWRKGLHAFAALIFIVFAALVAVRGGLTPWA